MFTQKQIEKMSRKNLSVDQFLTMAKRCYPEVKLSRNKLFKLEAGTFLGIQKTKRGKWYRLFLKKIWITPIGLSYRTTDKVREGKEIIISPFPLPKNSFKDLKPHG